MRLSFILFGFNKKRFQVYFGYKRRGRRIMAIFVGFCQFGPLKVWVWASQKLEENSKF